MSVKSFQSGRSISAASLSGLSDNGSLKSWNQDRQSWQPDMHYIHDSTELNLKKQSQAKDPRVQLKEEYERQKEVMKLIQDLIRKPFYVKRRDFPLSNQPIMEAVSENSLLEETVMAQPEMRPAGKMVTAKIAAKKKYVVVHFNYYFKVKGFYYPSEFAMAEFSVYNGLGRGVNGLIDIKAPLEGFDGDVREHCRVTGNPYPSFDEDFDFDSDRDALKLIIDFLDDHFSENEVKIMFALKEFIPVVQSGLEWLFDDTGKRFEYQVLPITSLVKELVNESQSSEYGISNAEYEVQHESLLEKDIHHNCLAYYPDLACEYHAKICFDERRGDELRGGGLQHCCEVRVKSMIYNSLNVLQPLYMMKEKEGSAHFPQLKMVAPKRAKINDMRLQSTDRRKQDKATPRRRPFGFPVFEMQGTPQAVEVVRFTNSDRMSDYVSSRSGGSEFSVSRNSLSTSKNITDDSDSDHTARMSRSTLDAEGSEADDEKSVSLGNQKSPLVDVNARWNPDLSRFKNDPNYYYGYNVEMLEKKKNGAISDPRITFEEGLLRGEFQAQVKNFFRSSDDAVPVEAIPVVGDSDNVATKSILEESQKLARWKGRGYRKPSMLEPVREPLPMNPTQESEGSTISDGMSGSTLSVGSRGPSLPRGLRTSDAQSLSSFASSNSSTLPDNASAFNVRVCNTSDNDTDTDTDIETQSLAAMKRLSFG